MPATRCCANKFPFAPRSVIKFKVNIYFTNPCHKSVIWLFWQGITIETPVLNQPHFQDEDKARDLEALRWPTGVPALIAERFEDIISCKGMHTVLVCGNAKIVVSNLASLLARSLSAVRSSSMFGCKRSTS